MPAAPRAVWPAYVPIMPAGPHAVRLADGPTMPAGPRAVRFFDVPTVVEARETVYARFAAAQPDEDGAGDVTGVYPGEEHPTAAAALFARQPTWLGGDHDVTLRVEDELAATTSGSALPGAVIVLALVCAVSLLGIAMWTFL
jgi:hypothetical protein